AVPVGLIEALDDFLVAGGLGERDVAVAVQVQLLEVFLRGARQLAPCAARGECNAQGGDALHERAGCTFHARTSGYTLMQQPCLAGSTVGRMKRLIRIFIGLVITLGALNAHARVYNQAELDALLAPIALYPDPLLNNILDAAQYPDDVMAAAEWSRNNPGVQGDAALQAVDGAPWAPSVKSLVAYPDILARLAESPQWLADLGDAYATHGPYIQTTIQQLRARAQSNGYLQSDTNQYVYQQAGQIYVQPVYPTVVYVPYYNPWVVYGTWWWPAYRPVC